MNHSSLLIIYAFLALIIGNLFAVFVDIAVKAFAVEGSVYQYLLLRQLLLLLCIFPFWYRQSAEKRHPRRLKVHAFRGLMTNIGAPAAVISLLYLPLATANVIFYTAPLFTLLLGTLLFKEPLKTHRIVVTVLGFIGVGIALRPEYFGFASALAFCTAIAVAGYNISVKSLPKQISTITTMFWSNLFTIPIMTVITLMFWQPITADLIWLCVISCLCLLVYQGLSVIAFKRADAGAITVTEYSGLIFAAVFGWWLFDETLDNWTLFGITCIILPIIWQSWYEHKCHQINDSDPNLDLSKY
ncbi:DMT family transporter [Spartinivicinus poritis]|uniref:DMT family transporter n=1 Tax=Spartinivicinus poritis TaxID=2994640 RepID=A0ABT5UAL9_9GAMM|nr:DMT family transporter [Spartinivicinus sp. A2-2]MDE1463431.1 DMT family transporter [Spartinivicinus sp. A2-2]